MLAGDAPRQAEQPNSSVSPTPQAKTDRPPGRSSSRVPLVTSCSHPTWPPAHCRFARGALARSLPAPAIAWSPSNRPASGGPDDRCDRQPGRPSEPKCSHAVGRRLAVGRRIKQQRHRRRGTWPLRCLQILRLSVSARPRVVGPIRPGALRARLWRDARRASSTVSRLAFVSARVRGSQRGRRDSLCPGSSTLEVGFGSRLGLVWR